MSKTRKSILIISISIIVLFIGVTLYLCYALFSPQFRCEEEQYIYIYPNDSSQALYQQVKEKGNPKSMVGVKLLGKYFQWNKKNIQEGRYALRISDTPFQLMKRIYAGHQSPVSLRVPSVRTLGGMYRRMAKQLMMDSSQIAQIFQDTTTLHQLGYNRETLPAFFIPNTYEVYWNITPKQLLDRMIKEHNHFWNDKRLKLADSIQYTPIEVATIASIVAEETNNAGEKPMVAGLYINRIHQKIPLQADPTIRFALQDFTIRRINKEQLKTVSPYNTYLNPGLPPGPIRIVNPADIDAVLHYISHPYIYMCAKEDFSGTHNFATTYAEHLKNAQKYWKELNKRKIFK